MKKKLTSEHQTFIVQSLAYFMTPSEIVEALKTEFNVTISRQLVRDYNPQQVQKSQKKWGKLFDEARKEYLASPHNVGIAHLTHRLDRLNQLMVNAIRMKNYPLAAQLLEQAAKDSGGLFTNKQLQEVKVDQRMQLPSVEDWKKKRPWQSLRMIEGASLLSGIRQSSAPGADGFMARRGASCLVK
jgi:hypothetical protein